MANKNTGYETPGIASVSKQAALSLTSTLNLMWRWLKVMQRHLTEVLRSWNRISYKRRSGSFKVKVFVMQDKATLSERHDLADAHNFRKRSGRQVFHYPRQLHTWTWTSSTSLLITSLQLKNVEEALARDWPIRVQRSWDPPSRWSGIQAIEEHNILTLLVPSAGRTKASEMKCLFTSLKATRYCSMLMAKRFQSNCNSLK